MFFALQFNKLLLAYNTVVGFAYNLKYVGSGREVADIGLPGLLVSGGRFYDVAEDAGDLDIVSKR